jgi:hypothetical protein
MKHAKPNPTRARKPSARLRHLQVVRPRTPDELHRFVKVAFGLDVPRAALSDQSNPPFDYLLHTFFEKVPGVPHHTDANTPPAAPDASDAVVWANRGGGKTMLGAVATLLDLIFKPGIQVRILGGSLEQSSKMYEHLLALIDRPVLHGIVATAPTQRRVVLQNGSRAAMLAQSQRSVRGVRVHKLRCDEVEEFDPAVWQACQLVTRSGMCGGRMVRGCIDALSTMHRPGGLMAKLTSRPHHEADHPHATQSFPRHATLFKWNALDVIEQCPTHRPCDACDLWPDCHGKAKHARGFMKVDDLLAQRQRTSETTWASEMMCRRPQISDSVYPSFELARHVIPHTPHATDKNQPREYCIAGMDFGLRSPTVMLWALVYADATDAPEHHRVHVVDEYIECGLTLEQHLAAIGQRPWPQPLWIGVDPAGKQRNSQTGLTDIQILQKSGLKVRARKMDLRSSIERVRRRFDRDTLHIHPRCGQLIAALANYHFDPRHVHRDDPVKDGPDHACDALRYMLTNLELGHSRLTTRSYFD